MKRVKIMLTAITVFAVVGGALAFKAKDFNFQTYFITDGTHSKDCNVQVTTLTENTSTGVSTKASTSTGTNNCSTFLLTTQEG